MRTHTTTHQAEQPSPRCAALPRAEAAGLEECGTRCCGDSKDLKTQVLEFPQKAVGSETTTRGLPEAFGPGRGHGGQLHCWALGTGQWECPPGPR